MTWIREHQQVWRVVVLLSIFAGIIGPWFFDLINVPAEYECHPPNYRLYGDFCGSAISGSYFALALAGEVVYRIATPAAQQTEGLFSPHFISAWLGAFMIVLPVFTTLFLCLRPDHPRMSAFQIAVCVIAAGLALVVALNSYPRLFYVVWGVWLYITGTVVGAAMEALSLLANRPIAQAV